MTVFDDLTSRRAKLAVVGLGYVGLPIAVEFAKKLDVIGFDTDVGKVEKLRRGVDPTDEVGARALGETDAAFTADPALLRAASFFVIAVPTPINTDKTPDLAPVVSASQIVGDCLRKGAVVVYESTVYPGVTEEVCLPILEQRSGLRCGVDFKIGYSPERINPGDRVHRLPTIRKIVSGMDEETLDTVASVYALIITAGVYRASSIKVAEAAKVVENSQRDINIAFINEMAMVFDRIGIDTNDVIDAMNTKWNALGFRPGLVGGHCIGVDPYYFIYEAEKLGYHSQIVLSGRKVNDGMGMFVADAAIKKMILAGKTVKSARVAIFGMTFKENCPDVRNSKVYDIIQRLREYGVDPLVIDPVADPEETQSVYGITLTPISAIFGADCLIFAVAHQQFRDLTWAQIDQCFEGCPARCRVLLDVKGMFRPDDLKSRGYAWWRL